MADRLTTIIDIQTGESVKATAALADAEARLKKESTELHKRLVDEAKAHERVASQVRSAAKTTQDATAKLDQMIRREQLAAKIAKEHGTSVQAARRAVSSFGRDLDRADKEAAGYARALDRAQKETLELTRAQRAASRTAGSHILTVRNLTQAFGVLAGAAGIRAAIAAMSDWIDKAERQDRALSQVEARLRSTGNTIGLTTAEIAQMASEIQRATGIGDEALLEQAGVILSFTEITKENFRGTLEAALDMAAALGKDVPSQVLALSKALSDGKEGLTQLKRSGTIFRGELKEQIVALFDAGRAGEAQALILKEVNRQYGGAAKAAREHGGTVAALKTEFADLEEALGQLILGPGGLRDFIEVMTDSVRGTTNLIKGAEGLSESLGSLWLAFAQVNAVVNPLRVSTNALRGAFDYYKKSLEALGLQQVKFQTWADKNREAMQAALVVQKRWTEETKSAASWEDRMAAAVKAASEEIEQQEKAAAAALREQEAMNERLAAAHLRLAADRHKDRAETFADYGKEIKLLDDGLRTRKEILAAQKSISREHREAIKKRKADEKAAADAAKKAEEERIEALRAQEELWNQIAETAFAIADAIGGKWGDMLGNLISGVLGIRDAWKQVQAAQGQGQQLMAGFGLGQQAGGLLSGLGISSGPGQAGGLLSGLGGALGTALGGPLGGVLGGVAGQLLGGLKIFQQGGDTTTEAFELFGGRLTSVATKTEGDASLMDSFAGAVVKGFNGILASLGGFVGPGGLGAFDIKIREEKDKTYFQVREFGKTVAKFEDEAAAVADAIRRLLQGSDIQGLSKNVEAALQTTTAASFEQLAADLERARQLDLALMTDQERYLAVHTQMLREQANAYADLGVDMNDFLEMMVRTEEAANRAAEMQALQLAGVDTSLAAGMAAFDQLRAQVAAQEELNAAYQAMAASLNTVQTSTAEWDREMERLGREFPGFAEGLEKVGRRMEETGETFEVAVRSIEGIDAELLERAAEAFQLMQVAGFLRQVADLTGNTELAAAATELENQARRLQVQLMMEQLRAFSLLSPALEQVINDALAAYDAAVAAGETLGTPVKTGRGGGGRAQERKRAEEEAKRAAEDFNASVALMTRRLSGASAAEIAAADALAELTEKGKEAWKSTEEVAAAVSMLAELQLRDLAADWTQAAQDLGKVDLKLAFEQIRKRAAETLATALASAGANPDAYRALREAVRAGMAAEMRELGRSALSGGRFGLRQDALETARNIRFLMRHLEELGLTANQVGQNVRDAVLPDLLGIIKTEAQRTGSLDEYNAALAQEAQLQRIMTRIRLEGMELELRAANALTPAFEAMFDTARRLLDLPTMEGGTTGAGAAGGGPPSAEQLANISRQKAKERAAGGTGAVTGGGTTGETTAEIIARLERERASEMERLEMDFQALFQSIADSTGTAAEKAQALALAEEDLAKKRQELQDRQFEGLRDLAKSLEAEIIASKAPKAQIEAKQAAFQAAAANVNINDEASVKAFEEAAREYLDAAKGYGELVGSGVIYTTAKDAVAQILASFGIGAGATSPIPQGFGPPPGIAPTGIGGTSFLPPSAPPPIVVNAPAGQAANIGALSREIASLRSEVADFKKIAQTNFAAWIPARDSVAATGNWIRRRGG